MAHRKTRRQLRQEAAKKRAAEEKVAKKGPTKDSTRVLQFAEEYFGFFHTEDQEAYATTVVDGGVETLRIKDAKFRSKLTHLFWEKHGRAVSKHAVTEAIDVLEGVALFKGAQQSVYRRVAPSANGQFFDLGPNGEGVIEVDHSDFYLAEDPDVNFWRPQSMGTLPMPVKAEEKFQRDALKRTRRLLNLSKTNFKLIMGFCLGALRAIGPYPPLLLEGEQGSGKSTLARWLQSLIDPSALNSLRSLPQKTRDLVIAAHNAWLLAFDNLAYIKPWLSDDLSKLSTGAAFATRKLYADSEEVMFRLERPVIINGIDIPGAKDDLLDRFIVVRLEAIPPEERMTLAELNAELDELRPIILGVLFEAVSLALRRFSEIRLESTPRMADFAHWVTAGERAFQWDDWDFLEAYEANRETVAETAVEKNPVASVIRELMDDSDEPSLTFTFKQLLEELSVKVGQTTRESKWWPQSASALSRKVKLSATALRQVGIEVVPGRRTGPKRPIVLRDIRRLKDLGLL